MRAGPGSPWLLILVAVGAGAAGWLLGRSNLGDEVVAQDAAREVVETATRGTDGVRLRGTARVRREILVRVPPGATTLTLSAAPEAGMIVVEPLAFWAFTGQSGAQAPTIGVVGPDSASGGVQRWAVITDTDRSPHAWLRLSIEHAAGVAPPILWASPGRRATGPVAVGVMHDAGGRFEEVLAFDRRAGGFRLPAPGPGR